jgi:formamidopyrimidine-DNA glycosylase
MPELPDVTVYVERAQERLQGQVLRGVKLLNPFLLRTAVPPITEATGRRVLGVQRVGKRVVLVLQGELFLVIHLMVAGRLRWLAAGAKLPGKLALAVFEFDAGQLVFTEAGARRMASLHLLAGAAALAAIDPGGAEVLEIDLPTFEARLRSESHTLKRALTNPHQFSGIGNAYSDEILHHAQLSPLALSRSLPAADVQRLYHAVRHVMQTWTQRLREQSPGWPEKVTAFRPEMAVHGRYGLPCPVCQTPVQRIVYATNECNYCARCQTGGKLLADRAMSKLLKDSWPRNIDDLWK